MKRYKPLFEAYDDATEKKLDAKGYIWSKGKDKVVRVRGVDFWKEDKSGDIDYELYSSKIIKTNHDDIKNVNDFFVCFFGDKYSQTYEYGAISTKESELYELMRKWDIQEGALGKFNKDKQTVKYFIVYPFEDGK